MAYDEGLATRIRDAIGDRPGLAEKQMFGGLAFLVHGNMACGVRGDDLIACRNPGRTPGSVAGRRRRPRAGPAGCAHPRGSSGRTPRRRGRRWRASVRLCYRQPAACSRRPCWRWTSPRADLLAPLQPPLDQLADRPRVAVATLTPVELLQELGLDLLGLAPGRLGLPADLAAEPPFVAGEEVAAGEHLHLEALSPLPDHARSATRGRLILELKNDRGMPRNDRETSKASYTGL